MANESPAGGAGSAGPQRAPTLSPAERARLAQCFQHGQQSASKDIDYAIEMFSTCVTSDPSNAVYLQHLLGCLRIKHGGKKAGGLSALWTAGGRGGLRRLAAAGRWRDVLGQGLPMIKSNPSDHASLLVLAEAAGRLGYPEVQRVYLKAALDAAPADVEVNRTCASFLASYGEYDQAIACWRRIEKAKGMADEASRQIAQLQVDKTISAGHGLTGRKPPAGAAKADAAAATKPEGTAVTAAEKPADDAAVASRRGELERTIAARPGDVEAMLELADVLEREATLDEAHAVLAKALEASGNALRVREHLEDRQLQWLRNRLHVAEKRLVEEETADNRETAERLRATVLKHEIEFYSTRVARYPENVSWKHELAVRLKASGNHAEAIKHFQEVLRDARRKGAVALELGECFQKIRQYSLALRSYQSAVESLTERELDLKKRALYRAGVLATALEDVDSARKYLSALAELDFGYRDVAERLDKLTPAQHKEVGS